MSQNRNDVERVERLAREVMGWTEAEWDSDQDRESAYLRAGMRLIWFRTGREWDPFSDANADVQVLERVRGTWQEFSRDETRMRRWYAFKALFTSAVGYEVGDYARAALAVLDATKEG